MKKNILAVALLGLAVTGCAMHDTENINSTDPTKVVENNEHNDRSDVTVSEGNEQEIKETDESESLLKNYTYHEIDTILTSHADTIQTVQDFLGDQMGVRDAIKVGEYFYFYAVGDEWGIYRCNIDGSELTLIGDISVGPNELVVACEVEEGIMFITKDMIEGTDGPSLPEPQSQQYLLIDGETIKEVSSDLEPKDYIGAEIGE